MNGRSSKDARHRSFFAMDEDSFGRSNLMIASSVANDCDNTIISNIIHKPTNLITVCFDDHFVGFAWIDRSDGCPIGIYHDFIYIGFDIVDPYLLSCPLKSGRRRHVDEFFKECNFRGT